MKKKGLELKLLEGRSTFSCRLRLEMVDVFGLIFDQML